MRSAISMYNMKHFHGVLTVRDFQGAWHVRGCARKITWKCGRVYGKIANTNFDIKVHLKRLKCT